MATTAKTTGLTRAQSRRVDGVIENAMSGMGIPGVDVAESSTLSMCAYTPQQARNQHRFSWAARQQVDQPAGDLIREGYEITELPSWASASEIKAYLAGIGTQQMLEDRGALQALSRLYGVGNTVGGALAVMIVADGLEPWEPLDLDRVEDLISIEVLERDEVWPYRSEAGGPVEYYVIGTTRCTIDSAAIVHHSRVLLSRGQRLMPSEEHRADGWGASVLEASHGPRMAMHSANQEMASLVLKTTQDVIYFAELAEMMCDEKTGATASGTIDERIALLARTRSQHRVIPLDAGRSGVGEEPARPSDSMASLARPVRGVADLAPVINDAWASSIGQPSSIANKKTLGGLNTGTNAGDWQTWGGFVGREQTVWLRPRLDRIIEVACAAKLGPTKGKVPKGWETTFPPLWQPTAKEEADTAAVWAGVDTSYQTIAGVTPEQIYEQRMVQGATGQLHLDPLPEPEEPAPEVGPDGEPLESAPEEESEPTEDEIAWSEAEPPADADTAKALVEGGELGSTSTQQIHSMARRGEITAYRGRSASVVPLYSLAEVKRAILIRNGVLEAEPEPEDVETDRADASRWRRLVGWLRGDA